MGLAAGQARLLSITSRKADCEYSSMRLSHEKISLSRDMNKISEEYQNATTQTKLVYDYYGKNDQSMQLSYDLLMRPSKLNNYLPSPITDTSGRVVLNGPLKKAVEMAGIPPEGLNGLPSSDARNKFIDGLAATGLINRSTADQIQKVQYNQEAGLGSTDVLKIQTEEGNYSDIIERLSNTYLDFSDLVSSQVVGGSQLELYQNSATGSSNQAQKYTNDKISLGELLSGNFSIRGTTDDFKNLKGPLGGWSVVDKVGSADMWDYMFDQFEGLLDTGDSYTQAALEYAKQQLGLMLECLSDPNTGEEDMSNYAYESKSQSSKAKNLMNQLHGEVDKYVGHVYIHNKDRSGGYNDGYGVNISSMMNAYLTFFAQYMDEAGLGDSDYNVDKEKAKCNFVGNEFKFTLVNGAETSGDNLLIANFYDTLFNQICTSGYVVNENIDDNKYLQEMLQNGSMYISTINDDGFYYQGNYATNTYIKEITDETAIAQAEARYTREKNKITYKENVLDLKMKNLDTEISALTTEYDSVKNVISKNIEKSFKRYSA